MRLTRRGAMAGTIAAAGALPLSDRIAAQSPGAPHAEEETADPVEVVPALTSFVATFRDGGPVRIRERARLHILDTLASIVACHDLEAARLGRGYALAYGPGTGATILGTRTTANIVPAAFAGAMTGHAAEINDFIPSAYVQPGPAIVSAAMGLAERDGASGARLIDAIIVGYEFAGRIPKAIGNRTLQQLNIANHAIGPTFGAAMASAVMLNFDGRKVDHALSCCAQQASGAWQWLLDVRHIEKAFVFAGMGARNGLEAALLVEQGFTGVPASFDTPGTWFRSRAFGDVDRSGLIEGLGERFELDQAAFKRYPTGGPTQPAVQALLDLRKTVEPARVEKILIEMPGRADAFRDARMPALNLPYLASIIMLDGQLDFVAAQSLERMAGDPDVADFMKRVSVVEDEAQVAPAGEARVESARVTIATSDGKRHTRFVPYVHGFPTHPMSSAEVEAKAIEIMAPRLGAGLASRVAERSRTLDGPRPVRDLIALLGG